MCLRPLNALLGITLGIAAVTFVAPPARAEPTTMSSQPLQLAPGDVIAHQQQNGEWSVVKVLLIDILSDDTSTAHCLTYQNAISKPELSALHSLDVRAWHAPILASSFASGWVLVGNQAATKEELRGFIEYLKLTDFPRYIQFTGQDAKEIVRKANEHYQRAIELGDQQKQLDAIAEYSLAVDLFPLFFEAIDNRGFTYMEIGRYKDALADFELSLDINPDGFAAFFSKGECLMRLGDLDAAESVFKDGVTRFPQQEADFSKYLEIVRRLKRGG